MPSHGEKPIRLLGASDGSHGAIHGDMSPVRQHRVECLLIRFRQRDLRLNNRNNRLVVGQKHTRFNLSPDLARTSSLLRLPNRPWLGDTLVQFRSIRTLAQHLSPVSIAELRRAALVTPDHPRGPWQPPIAGLSGASGCQAASRSGLSSGIIALRILSAGSERVVQRMVTPFDGSSHEQSEHRRQQPVDVLDMRDADAMVPSRMNRKRAMAFEKPGRHNVATPREQLAGSDLLDGRNQIHRWPAR
jgi:hypothetical protein